MMTGSVAPIKPPAAANWQLGMGYRGSARAATVFRTPCLIVMPTRRTINGGSEREWFGAAQSSATQSRYCGALDHCWLSYSGLLM
jgi:hypothetical protein